MNLPPFKTIVNSHEDMKALRSLSDAAGYGAAPSARKKFEGFILVAVDPDGVLIAVSHKDLRYWDKLEGEVLGLDLALRMLSNIHNAQEADRAKEQTAAEKLLPEFESQESMFDSIIQDWAQRPELKSVMQAMSYLHSCVQETMMDNYPNYKFENFSGDNA